MATIDASTDTNGDVLEHCGVTVSTLASEATVEGVLALQDSALDQIEKNRQFSYSRKESLRRLVISKCQARCTAIEDDLEARDRAAQRSRPRRAAFAGSPAIAA